MTKVKLCGMKRIADIQAVDLIKPDFIGFVFAPKSKRYVTPEQAADLRSILSPDIAAVGVFVNEKPETIAGLLNTGVIDLAQLHGSETENDIAELRKLSSKPIIRAFKIREKTDLQAAADCSADIVLLDAGAGDGIRFDWELLEHFDRPYFLAGGLDPENVRDAITRCHPYAVDVSSGIETDGFKDRVKMQAFVSAVRAQ